MTQASREETESSKANSILRSKIQEALNDPRPDIPAAEVFARLRAYHEKAENGAPRNSTPS
jgi:antitoxin ParD1/3/4